MEAIEQRWFYYMEQISAIPRGSGDTQRMTAYLLQIADELGLSARQDSYGNVIIKKAGSEGREEESPVILQGHMDMVCEKCAGSNHDFTKDGLELYVENGMLRAKDTTLGADDGIAIAYALSILESSDMSHPPIELVVTTDEEIGMLGASALEVSTIQGKRMINIDSEEDGVVLVSCAGGGTASLNWNLKKEKVTKGWQLIHIVVDGLCGGHSGIEIGNRRENASILLGRVLGAVRALTPFCLSELTGGSKDNAIPVRSAASLWIPQEQVQKVLARVSTYAGALFDEMGVREPNLRITASEDKRMLTKIQESANDVVTACTVEQSGQLLHFLISSPQGVMKESDEIEGLIETSLNLGILQMTENICTASYSVRSSKPEAKEWLFAKLRCLAMATGASFSLDGLYSAWEYEKCSPLRELYLKCYREITGEEARQEAIHAGLECGIICEKLPGMDIISIGADTLDIHTPNEALDIASAERVYQVLLRMLELM